MFRKFSPALVTAVVVGCATTTPPPTPAPAPPSVQPAPPPDYSRVEREILRLVNLERARHHLDTLVLEPRLDKAAKIQAVNMAGERRMAHELPDANYPTLMDRIRHVEYPYRHLSENIAYGYPTAAYTVSAWMASAGHRANILDRSVTETGIGVARASSGELYFCQVFGSRRGF